MLGSKTLVALFEKYYILSLTIHFTKSGTHVSEYFPANH